MTPRSAIYSPQLPAHPQRQRLSLRPSSLRGTSTTPAPPNPVEEDSLDGLNDDSLDADALNEVIMALDMKENGNLGCAYYIAADEALFLLEDVAAAGVEIVETLLVHAKPTTVLTPARTSQALLSLLAKGSDSEDGDDHDRTWPAAYILRTLKSTDFRYESARDKLLDLRTQQGDHAIVLVSVADELGDEHGREQGSMQGSLLRLGTFVNLESRLTIGCAGAVLGDIQRRRTAQYLPNDPDALVAFAIRSVEMFSLFDSMFVNADTLVSLQILQSEFHPNNQMRGPDKSNAGAKESLSVYGLFHFLACTPQGKSKLRKVFLRPSLDIDLITARQRTISFFIRPEHSDALATLTKDLRKIRNMRTSIAHLQKGVDTPGQRATVANNVWAAIQRFALHTLQIHETLAQMSGAEKIPIVRKVTESIYPATLRLVGEVISRTIDFEQSRERQRTAVKQGIDANLDEMKRSYEGMDNFLTEVNNRLRSDIPEWAQKYVQGCVFYPQLGFLTVVSLNSDTGKANYEGEGLNDVWDHMFTNDGVIYCKNRRMKEMDERFGDAYCMIIDREIEVLHELSVRLLEHEDAILAASDVLGELDSILALAIGSRKYNWVAPRMTTENVLHIQGGRHPLQELVVPSFVSNGCHLRAGDGAEVENPRSDGSSASQNSKDAPSTLVLTGPNHSGKSVYLKQVAVIVYLAHIGCFIPAERATIGLTDRILTRIATRESVVRQESAFAIDLRQAAFAINFATRRSLILIDEFGKGTDSADGAGLVTALLHHFTVLGSERPKLLAATHYHEIFEGNFLSESPHLSFAHMDVHIDFDASNAEDQLTYLFKLKPGRSVSSFGSRCAAMNGIDGAVVKRAEAIMLLLVRGEDLEAVCSKLSVTEEARLEEAESVARAFLEHDIEAPKPKGKQVDGTYRATLGKILVGGPSISDIPTTADNGW
ncbi:uncharacterized protein JN550_012743 [Neoarthrinium moseri]|uniref:uncharacterized protein n=1 Tax=Neoarthrinium moseri TaxID=1658444 RepID=UPI001FDDC219|nr:uncharacterized protein JN550_012743 [Neoarthrinium moseri]KAI1858378.1 hypothetical protein JN550_012743 [Neoarthrinium moseri]